MQTAPPSVAKRPSSHTEKIAANRLVIDCIYVLSKEELSKVDRELEWIASDFLMQDLGIRR